MIEVIGLVAPLFAVILLGYISARIVNLPIEGLAWLNIFIVYLALPALFFRLLSKTPLTEFANTTFLVCTTGATFLVFLIGFFLAKFRSQDSTEDATIQGLAGAYGNIGYLGPPLALAAFGPAAGVPVALVFCLDNTMHFTVTPLLMSLGDRRSSWFVVVLRIFKNIFTHPFIIATIVGVAAAYYQFEPAEPVNQVITNLSNAAAPCALFALGVSAALRPLERIPSNLIYLLPIKLILHPVLVYLAVSWIPGVSDVWVFTAVLLAALPTATNVFVLAQQYGYWEQRASSTVVLSTAASVITVTGYLYLAKNGHLL